MPQIKILNINYFLPLSCALAFCFSITVFDFPKSTPWDFINFFEMLGFISFVSVYSPLFWQLIGSILLIIVALLIFIFTFMLQKKLLQLKIITPVFSLFLVGCIFGSMVVTTFMVSKIKNYYHRGVVDGTIAERIKVFDEIEGVLQHEVHDSLVKNPEIISIDKSMRMLELVTIQNVKTLRVKH